MVNDGEHSKSSINIAVDNALGLSEKSDVFSKFHRQLEIKQLFERDDVIAALKHELLSLVQQHRDRCCDSISEVKIGLEPGIASHYRRMKALNDLAEIDRFNEELLQQATQLIDKKLKKVRVVKFNGATCTDIGTKDFFIQNAPIS